MKKSDENPSVGLILCASKNDEVVDEIHLSRDDRDLIRLHRYAELLGCKKSLGTYLEVLL